MYNILINRVRVLKSTSNNLDMYLTLNLSSKVAYIQNSLQHIKVKVNKKFNLSTWLLSQIRLDFATK